MRRTWIGAAAVACLTTVAATALAVAQENEQKEQPPASQRMENGQHGKPGQGQTQDQTKERMN